ncbi:glycosyl transferase family protein [uncultured Paraglaciecola sp.]|uniref:glycosyl transferase family protein n=1 Tax=uncultured Paraglaciecola sp. TaxID=1765024 RepID=UPI0025ECCA98|nr:glycosyl transferase family protein [uncultured Paraglaciecola sp.]
MTDTPTDFKDFIRIIGRGQRAGRTLTQQEAYQAMSMLINGQATAEQKGAFLMLLRVREETAEELAGFSQAFRAYTPTNLTALTVDLDMGCYAGKRRHLPWFLLAVLLLAQSGKRIFLHGTHEPDSKRLYLKEVLPQLGFDIAQNPAEADVALDTFGFAYMDLKQINPQLDDIIQLREQFGLRSCANTLARMLNPSNASHSLQGIFHRLVDEKHRKTAALLKDQNVLCFRGEGGEIEFNPLRDVTLHISRSAKQECTDVNATCETFITKPQALDAKQLIDVWTGLADDTYANHAVVGTLSVMLVLVNKLEWAQAYQQAEVMWQGRDKTWPVALPDAGAQSTPFDTTGKHYAH